MTHGTRTLILIIAVTLAVLVIGVPFSLYEQNQEAIRRNAVVITRLVGDEKKLAETTAAQRRSLCLSGNDYRQGDADLWHFLLTSFSTPNPSPEERRRTAQFVAYLAVHDKLRDCSKF